MYAIASHEKRMTWRTKTGGRNARSLGNALQDMICARSRSCQTLVTTLEPRRARTAGRLLAKPTRHNHPSPRRRPERPKVRARIGKPGHPDAAGTASQDGQARATWSRDDGGSAWRDDDEGGPRRVVRLRERGRGRARPGDGRSPGAVSQVGGARA